MSFAEQCWQFAEVALGRHSHERKGPVVLATPAEEVGVHRTHFGQLLGGVPILEQPQGECKLAVGDSWVASTFGPLPFHPGGKRLVTGIPPTPPVPPLSSAPFVPPPP